MTERTDQVPGYTRQTFPDVFTKPPPYKSDFKSGGYLTKEQFHQFFDQVGKCFLELF